MGQDCLNAEVFSPLSICPAICPALAEYPFHIPPSPLPPLLPCVPAVPSHPPPLPAPHCAGGRSNPNLCLCRKVLTGQDLCKGGGAKLARPGCSVCTPDCMGRGAGVGSMHVHLQGIVCVCVHVHMWRGCVCTQALSGYVGLCIHTYGGVI